MADKGARPRLLDLFCGAGGAAVGYHRAGFDVVGVDNRPQPHYPYQFLKRDALIRVGDRLRVRREFDAIHASPPCPFYTELQSVVGTRETHPELITPLRELLEETGLPYVIENVPGARAWMRDPITLCGSMFGLAVPEIDRELRRHRLFETNWPIGLLPSCAHQRRAVGVYGDHLRLGRRSSQGELSGPEALRLGKIAMGIDFEITWDELKDAIPPPMTEFIGLRLADELAGNGIPAVAA